MALGLRFERDVLVSLAGIAVAEDHNVDGEFLDYFHNSRGRGEPVAAVSRIFVFNPCERGRSELCLGADMVRIRLIELCHIGVSTDDADIASPIAISVLDRGVNEVVFTFRADHVVEFLMCIIVKAQDLNGKIKIGACRLRGLDFVLRPLCDISHVPGDRCRNFGLPACEGVAAAVRVFAERGGRVACVEVLMALIGEHFVIFNAVGVDDDIGVGGRCYFALDIEGRSDILLPDRLAFFLVLREVPEHEGADVRGAFRFRVALMCNVECVDKRLDGLCNCAVNVIAGLALIFAFPHIPINRIGVASNPGAHGVIAVVVLHNALRLYALNLDCHGRLVTITGLFGLGGLGGFGLRAAAIGMRAAGDGAVALVILRVHAGVVIVAEAVAVIVVMLVLFLLPDRIDVHGVVRRSHVNRIADPRVVAGLPVLEGVAVAGGNLLRDSERRLARVVLLVLLTRHIGDSVCRAGLVVQDVGDGGGSRNLRNQINRCALIAGRRVRGI